MFNKSTQIASSPSYTGLAIAALLRLVQNVYFVLEIKLVAIKPFYAVPFLYENKN